MIIWYTIGNGEELDCMLYKRDEKGRFAESKRDLTGTKFNYLTVVGFSHRKGAHYYWDCTCQCGNKITTRQDSLKSSKTQSCGCLVAEKNGKHLKSHKRIYYIWEGMKSRCLYPKNASYKYYGGKGIRVCDEWLEFDNFYDWAIKNGYKKNLSIDRIDSGGDYCPSNCKWVTLSENSQKTGKEIPIIVTFPDGKRKKYRNVSVFCKEEALPRTSVYRNLKKGTHYKGYLIECN